jgi:hypothetical protein
MHGTVIGRFHTRGLTLGPGVVHYPWASRIAHRSAGSRARVRRD